MVDVFISYARENQAIVRLLADAVRREGYRVWWDDEIPPHLAYGDVISEKIGAAKAAIVVWSADSAASEWVRAEADVARGQKKLIQTSIDGREPPMPFNQIQVAPIGDWHGEEDHAGWRRVRQSLAALCGPGATDVAAAAPPITVMPPAPPPTPRRRASGAQPLLVALVGLLTVIVAVGGYYVWTSRAPGPDDEIVVASALPAGPPAAAVSDPPEQAPAMPPTAAFTQRATVVDSSGGANVRSGPTAISPIVGRVDSGSRVATYPQSGEWWQVRTAEGRFGYLNRAQLRVDAPPPVRRPSAPASAPAPAPIPPLSAQPAPQPAPTPVPRAGKDRLQAQAVDRNAIDRRRYCAGAGRNTPQCRQLPPRAPIRNY